jgi:hypothetical protein
MGADFSRVYDAAVQAVEEGILEILSEEWGAKGNIEVRVIQPARLLTDMRGKLPAILTEVRSVDFRGFVGGIIPVVHIDVIGAFPFVGTKEAHERLKVFGGRIAGILQSHYKREGVWNELRVRDIRFHQAESEPRWEGVVVGVEVLGIPIKLAVPAL